MKSDTQKLHAPLSQSIQKTAQTLIQAVGTIPTSKWNTKVIEGTGGPVSAQDLLSYQIGWGKNLIRWYKTGLQNKLPKMPLEDYSKWDYAAIAQKFYKSHVGTKQKQLKVFEQLVNNIISIVEKEFARNNLEKLGIWEWCTLPSGKEWPLSKWIQINTVAPYKRATSSVRNVFIKSRH